MIQIRLLSLKVLEHWTKDLTRFIGPVFPKLEFSKIARRKIHSISQVMNLALQGLYVLFLLSFGILETKAEGQGSLTLRNIAKPNQVDKLEYSRTGVVGICV